MVAFPGGRWAQITTFCGGGPTQSRGKIALVVAMLMTFAMVSAALTLIPGPDLMFIVRTGAHGRGPAVAAAFGAAASALIWGAAAAFGVAAVLQRSAEAFEVIKLTGAAYLIFLGLRTLWQSRNARGISPPTSDVPPPASARKAFGLGAGIDLLNPKTGLFYVAVLPQVIPHGMPVLRSTLLFAGVDSLVAAALFASVACAAAAFLTWLRRPGFVRGLDRTTGVCMVGLGIRTAIERV
ncbi:MAG TPA: LysE family translocator [Streptosporangiaceae bacterium]